MVYPLNQTAHAHHEDSSTKGNAYHIQSDTEKQHINSHLCYGYNYLRIGHTSGPSQRIWKSENCWATRDSRAVGHFIPFHFYLRDACVEKNHFKTVLITF